MSFCAFSRQWIEIPSSVSSHDSSTKSLYLLTKTFSPMIMKDNNDNLTGFDIEIAQEAAKIMDMTLFYSMCNSLDEMFTSIQDKTFLGGEAMIGAAGITITKDREEKIDFSHEYFPTGLKILIRDDNKTSILSQMKNYLDMMPKLLPIFIIMLSYCFIGSLMIWFFEKGNKMFDDNPRGIFDGFYWINVVLTTVGFGDKVPLSSRGKFLTVLLMWTGIFCIVPMVTGTIASELTSNKLSSYIQCKEDLRGKKIAVKKGTVASKQMEGRGSDILYVDNIEEGVSCLKHGIVDAVVHDAPAILYAEKNHKGLKALEETFEKQGYGFIFPSNSPYREKFNRALLELKENGTYDKLYKKYF